jgi:hypothetical protein
MTKKKIDEIESVEANQKRMTSPFKDVKLFEEEISDFANRFRTTVKAHSGRISDYFEMSCFNLIVKFYELKGYSIKIKNLQNKQYRYKCSPAGLQENFSYFEVSNSIHGKLTKFEIQHNLAVQSSHDKDIFTTPDIVVIKSRKIKTVSTYYSTKRRFCFIENKNLISFFEVKQFNPFPELLFNFIGVLNELKKEYISDEGISESSEHLAPSLMISGKSNKQTDNIKNSLEKRYCINIIFDLFHSSAKVFGKTTISRLRLIGRVPKVLKKVYIFEEESLI